MDVNAVIREPNKTLRMIREAEMSNTQTCPSLKPIAKSLPASEEDLSAGRPPRDVCLDTSALDKSMQQVISNCDEFADEADEVEFCPFFSLLLLFRLPLNVQAANRSPYFDMTSRLGPQNVTDMEQSSVTKPLIS